MDKTLQLLEGGGVAPDQGDAAAIGAEGALGVESGVRRPFRMGGGGIVIVHDDGVIARVQIKPHEPRGIGLLIDQC